VGQRYHPMIYIFKLEPSEKNLVDFNEAIRKNAVRRLPLDGLKPDDFGEIVQVLKIHVHVLPISRLEESTVIVRITRLKLYLNFSGIYRARQTEARL
jgi:hypothetical protein